jgi:phage protein D/phage baseplate assembly protein gpV
VADEYAAKPRIEIGGTALPDEVELWLESTVVDNHALLPDMVMLRFRDPDHDLVEKAGIEIGATVRILAAPVGQEATDLLIAAEVTGLEADFDASGSHVVVRGYDGSHRLHRGRRTETYRNVTESDVARTVARRAGLELGHIDETSTVHRQVSQANVSDWELLATRARQIGHEIGVVDGKFEFRKPPDADEAPESGDLASDDPLQLVLGADLERFGARVTSADQVKQVTVRGWDPGRKEAVVGTAPAQTVSASLALDPSQLASRFGDPAFVAVDRPLSSQEEVDESAKAIAEQIASGFAEADGIAHGNPAINAGASISVGLTGAPFEGLYTVTWSRHVFDSDGYKTHFGVSGRQVRSLLALLSANGATGLGTRGPRAPIPGVVPGQVTSVSDSAHQARVKLTFPWLSDTYESDWVRVVQPGAGNGRGFVVLPEVNDEVLVAFEHGDVQRPYVLGGLYNGEDAPPLADRVVDTGSGEVERRVFVSKNGHSIVIADSERDDGIVVATRDGDLRIALDHDETKVTISSKAEIAIEARADLTIRGKNVTLAGDTGVSIDGGSGNVTVKGRQVRLN